MRRRHRGLTLVDVLIALSLLGVFSVMAYRLLYVNFHVMARVRDANNASAEWDDAARMLRADVADSKSIKFSGDKLLTVRDRESATVEWKSEGNALDRKAGRAQRRWELSSPIKMKMDGSVLLLSTGGGEPIAVAPSLKFQGHP